ncbi:MAG: hypothetical protein UH734_08255 [Ruminococcus sp.]|nr:hypothetical protein [Ruminococcus sp.]
MKKKQDLFEIKRLASQFRSGIELAKEEGKFREYPFNQFPFGCCGDTSDLLAQYLFNHGITCWIVSGTYSFENLRNPSEYLDFYTHGWIELNGKIFVDITADQFNNNPDFALCNMPSCYVGKTNDFYDLFLQDINYRKSFRNLQELNNAFPRLQELYNIIIRHVKF